MSLWFEWDTNKAEANLSKHGISFEEAMSVFGDSLSLTVPDPLHSVGEERLLLLGYSDRNRLVVVVHTEIRERLRIISARLATKRERENYEEG